MADKKKGLPEDNAGSLLKAAAIGTPFVAGTGIASYKAYQEGGVQPLPASVKEAAKVLAEIQQKVSRPTYSAHLDFMNLAHQKGWFKGPRGGVAVRSAWQQAMAAAGQYSTKHLPSVARRIGTIPEDQLFDALKSLAPNENDITSSVFSRFRRNFEQFRGMGKIPTFTEVTGLSFAPITEGVVPKGISSRLSAMGQWSSSYLSRQGFHEEGLGLHQINLMAAGRNLKFDLPTTSGGVLVLGRTQSSRYIAGSIGILDPMTKAVKRMTRSEYFLEEVQKSILPDIQSGRFKSQRDVDKAISALYTEVFTKLENIPNIPAGLRDAHLQNYQAVRGGVVQLITPNRVRKDYGRDLSMAYRKANLDETKEAMVRHGFFPGTGPKHLASGLVQTVNPAEMGLIPEAYDLSRRSAEQAVRPFGFLNPKAGELNILYVDPTKYPEALQMGEGIALGKGNLARRLAVQRQTTTHLAAVAGEDIEGFIKAVEGGKFKPGDILGRDMSGNLVRMQKGTRLLQAIKNQTQGKGEHITLVTNTIKRLESNEKMFGDFKGLVQLVQDKFFERKVSRLTNMNKFFDNTQAIVHINELKKDPGKFSKQIITSMVDISNRRKGIAGKAARQAFVMKDSELTELLSREALAGGGFDIEKFTMAAMRSANEMRFSPDEWQRTFGAVPFVLGDKARGLMTQALGSERHSMVEEYWKVMQAGIAGGRGNVAWGGPEELRGAGAIGTIEPRTFDILGGSNFGSLGKELTQDIGARIHAANPMAAITHEELTKTMMSMGGLVKPGMGESIFDVSKEYVSGNVNKRFQEFIEQGGGWLAPGKGMFNVYVPGADKLAAMRPYTTVTGENVTTDIAGLYHQMASESARMYSSVSPIGHEDVQKEFQNIFGQLHKQQAPGGKGAGAYLRGPVAGSRYLTAVDVAGDYRPTSVIEAGIPKSYAEQMFREMRESGLYQKSALEEMEGRFLNYDPIGGMIVRHPELGEYSVQPITFRRVDTDLPQIALPEFNQTVRTTAGESVNLRLGPLVGLGADKDADTAAAMLVSPDIEKKIRKGLLAQDSEYLHRYLQHQVRYQLMSAKATGEISNLPTIQRMLGATEKLSTIKWVPELSLQMSSAKRAVNMYAGGAGGADAKMLLEWLEQTPIGSKHLSMQEAAEGELRATMEQLSGAMQSNDRVALKEVVTDVLAKNKTAGDLLRGGVTIQASDAAAIGARYGIKDFSANIAGLDLDKAIDVIMSSKVKYQASGAAREAELLLSKGKSALLGEIPRIASLLESNVSKGGSIAEVSRIAMAGINKLGAVGAGILEHKTPLALGFAASLGIATILSRPEDTIGDGAGLIPAGNIASWRGKAASEMKPETLMPEGQRLGNPTAPNMLRQHSAMISSPAGDRNIHVRSQMSGLSNSTLMEMVRQAGSGNRQVDVRLQDNRSSANRHIMANKLI